MSSFRQRNLTLKLAWISSFSSNILASIDQVLLINFQFRVSKIKFWYQNHQLKYFRITRAQLFYRVWLLKTTKGWSPSMGDGHPGPPLPLHVCGKTKTEFPFPSAAVGEKWHGRGLARILCLRLMKKLLLLPYLLTHMAWMNEAQENLNIYQATHSVQKLLKMSQFTKSETLLSLTYLSRMTNLT